MHKFILSFRCLLGLASIIAHPLVYAKYCGVNINAPDAGRATDATTGAIYSDAQKRKKFMSCPITVMDELRKSNAKLGAFAVKDQFYIDTFMAVRGKKGSQMTIARAIHAHALLKDPVHSSNIKLKFANKWGSNWCRSHANINELVKQPTPPDPMQRIKTFDVKSIDIIREVATKEALSKTTCEMALKMWVETIQK